MGPHQARAPSREPSKSTRVAEKRKRFELSGLRCVLPSYGRRCDLPQEKGMIGLWATAWALPDATQGAPIRGCGTFAANEQCKERRVNKRMQTQDYVRRESLELNADAVAGPPRHSWTPRGIAARMASAWGSHATWIKAFKCAIGEAQALHIVSYRKDTCLSAALGSLTVAVAGIVYAVYNTFHTGVHQPTRAYSSKHLLLPATMLAMRV